MKAREMVAKYCANYLNDKCLGLNIDGSAFREPGRCNPDDCSYFKRLVVPGVPKEKNK